MMLSLIFISLKEGDIMTCPICRSKAYEDCDLILFATATEPPEYSEPYMVCSRCSWNNKSEVIIDIEEIPF